MKKIKYTWEMLMRDCRSISREVLSHKHFFEIKNICGIKRGGLIPAVILSHILEVPLITNLNDITKHTLVVDDISDSGKTLNDLISDLGYVPPTATLWIDGETKFIPSVFCRMKKKTEWIVFPFETIKSSKKDN